MICPKCQSQIADNSVFCDKCGCRLSDYSQNISQQAESNNASAPAESAMPNAANNSQAPQNNYGMGQPADNNQGAGIPAQTFGQPAEPNAFGQNANGFVPNADTGNMPGGMGAPFTAAPQGFAAPVNNKPKKSFKKAIPFIIGGGVIAIAVTAFCCVKFAAADIAHTFMGDKKYATSLVRGTLDSAAENSGKLEKSLSSGLSSLSGNNDLYAQYIEYNEKNPDSTMSYSQFSQVKSLSSVFSAVSGVLPENGLYVKYGVKSELNDKFYELIAGSTGINTDDVKTALEAINGFSAEGKFSVKEDGLDIGYLISEDGNELDKGNIYYNTTDGILFYSNPSVYGSALSQKLMPLEIEIDKKPENSDSEKSDKEIKELVGEIVGIYSEHLEKAETEYSSVTESMGEAEFKGKSMKVTFDNEELADLLKDITIAVVESDYFTSLRETVIDGDGDYSVEFDLVDLKDQIEETFDKMAESDSKLSLTIEYFINADNSVAGGRISFSQKNGGNKNSAEFSYISDKSNYCLELEVNGTKFVKCEGTKTSDNSGKAEITFSIPQKNNDETKKLKITVEYSDVATKEFLGGDAVLGKFTVSLGGNIIDGLGTIPAGNDNIDIASMVKKTSFTITASDKDKGIEYQLELKNETYGTIGYTVEIGENTEPVSDRAGMTADASVDLSSGSAEIVDVKIGALKHIQDICSKSNLFGTVFNQIEGEDFNQQLQASIDQLEKNKKYIAVYSEYDSYSTPATAKDYARTIYNSLYGAVESKNPVIIKLYFDGEGNMSIIDMAGENEELLEYVKGYSDIKNAYVEINYFKGYNKYSPLGVSVVMTDSKDHHCEGLPTVYNFMDEVYDWSGDANYIGDYVVGTYPVLKKGETTSEQLFKEMEAKVAKYNEYSKKGFDAFNKYLNSKGNSFDFGNYSAHSVATFRIKSGTWTSFSGISSYNFKNKLDTNDLFSYMKTNVPDIPDGYLTVYVTNNKIVAASFSEKTYSYFNAPIFTVGATSDWDFIEGVADNTVIGTYPVLKSFDGTVSDKVKKLIAGTWVDEYDEETSMIITEEDTNCITEITYSSNEYVRVKFVFEDGSEAYVFFNLVDKLQFDYDNYIKK